MKYYCCFPVFVLIMLFASCNKADSPPPAPPAGNVAYFPPVSGTDWTTIAPSSLGWNENELASLYAYLQQKDTKAFIILQNGRIAVEKYFGSFTADSNWYWASAGKTMTAMLAGIAQEEGLLNINDRSSKYLGTGWTSLPPAKENLITVRHQLTMTTGLDDNAQPDNDCTLPSCLVYKSDAGTRWAYHNAPYTLLDKVIESAVSATYNSYFQQKIRDKTGMNGWWIRTGFNNVFYSNARSMARFGLLMLNKGKWDKTVILGDASYLDSQTNTSQVYNPSYGYLTWLNGKPGYMLPTLQNVFSGPMIPTAPADMYAALGKNDQKIYVVPSQQLVVIRMGESAGNIQLAVSSFDTELWGRLKTVIGY